MVLCVRFWEVFASLSTDFLVFATHSTISFNNKVYLSLLLFHEDRVLMTNEEILPLVYIDENNIKVKSELHWLAKLSYNWTEVSKLKALMTKTSTEQHFR